MCGPATAETEQRAHRAAVIAGELGPHLDRARACLEAAPYDQLRTVYRSCLAAAGRVGELVADPDHCGRADVAVALQEALVAVQAATSAIRSCIAMEDGPMPRPGGFGTGVSDQP